MNVSSRTVVTTEMNQFCALRGHPLLKQSGLQKPPEWKTGHVVFYCSEETCGHNSWVLHFKKSIRGSQDTHHLLNVNFCPGLRNGGEIPFTCPKVGECLDNMGDFHFRYNRYSLLRGSDKKFVQESSGMAVKYVCRDCGHGRIHGLKSGSCSKVEVVAFRNCKDSCGDPELLRKFSMIKKLPGNNDTQLRNWRQFVGEECSLSKSPLLLPSNYSVCKATFEKSENLSVKESDAVERLKKTSTGDVTKKDSKILLAAARREFSAGKKKGGYVYGALYKEIYSGCRIISVRNGQRALLNIATRNGAKTKFYAMDLSDQKSLLQSIQDLGCQLEGQPGNARRRYGNKGEMFILGLNHKKRKWFKLSKKKEVADAATNVAVKAGQFLRNNFCGVFDEMKGMDATKSGTGEVAFGASAATNTVVLTRNLANSAHVDSKDGSRSFCVWAESQPGLAQNPYFILPDVSIENSNGVAFEVFHGFGAIWDARLINHCTSWTSSRSKKKRKSRG